MYMSRYYSAEVKTLEHTPTGAVQVMSFDTLEAPHSGKGFASPAIRQELNSLEAGNFLLLPQEFCTVAPQFAEGHINIDPDKGRSREESRNQIKFGQLIINDSISRERVEYVAIKPLTTPNRAAHELGAMLTVNALAKQGKLSPALRPLGFYRLPDGDNRVALLTKYEHSVLTLDNLFWDPNYDPSEVQTRAALGHCAVSLGELHSVGIVHSDAQVKNIAADNRGVRYVDLEGAQKISQPSGRIDSFTARRLTEIDIRTCLESLNGHGQDLIADSFVPTYHDMVRRPDSTIPQDAVMESDEILEMVH